MPVPIPRCLPHDPDPFGLLDAFLTVTTPGSADAERVYLAWLISLDAALDPAQAAARLLAEHKRSRVAPSQPAHCRLLALLDATAGWPRPAVAAYVGGRTSPLELS